MSPDQQHPAQPQPPAGWYPDPSSGTGLRWWDGVRWTEHEAAGASTVPPYGTAAGTAPSYGAGAGTAPSYGASAAPPYPAAARPAPQRLPEGTPVGTASFWTIVLLPLLPVIVMLFWDADGYGRAIGSDLSPGRPSQPLGALDPIYFVLVGVGLAAEIASIVLAHVDWRTLTRRGVDRPFHWAWSFLVFVSGGLLVYVIGRSVVVRRRSGRGLAPLWVFIGVEVLAFVVIVVKLAMLLSALFSTLDLSAFSDVTPLTT